MEDNVLIIFILLVSLLFSFLLFEDVFGFHNESNCIPTPAEDIPGSTDFFHHHHYTTVPLPPLACNTISHFHHEHLIQKEPSNNGGGCSDCTPPTLGLDSNGFLQVRNGITINGHSKNGGYYHTAYPIQYTNLHQSNNISLKYYENSGAHNISIIQLGIGVKEVGTPISESQALIEVHMDYFSNDIENPVIKKIIVIDPDEMLHDVSASVQLSTCSESYDNTCLSTDFSYFYDKIPDSWVLSSNAIDYHRNTINNYFNDGLMVIDTNPVIDSVTPIEEEQYKYKCKDKTQNVMTRNNCLFELIKQSEIQRAQDTLDRLYNR